MDTHGFVARGPWHRAVLALMMLAVIPGAVAKAGPTPPPITLIYSSNLDGELEPCGCSMAGNLGGVSRRATMIRQLRHNTPGLFLISGGGLLSPFAAHGRLTNEYILKGMASLDYDAVGLQWSDLSYGAAFINSAPLPWVSSNWRGEDFLPSRLIERGGQKLAFFSWLDPATAPQKDMAGLPLPVGEDLSALERELKRARARGALTVLSTTLGRDQAITTLPLTQVDVLLVQAKYEVYGEASQHAHTLILQPGSRGMRLGRVDIQRDGAGRIARWQHQVIPLPATVPDAASLRDWYAAYSAAIKTEYLRLTELRKAQDRGETPYAGAEACAACHQSQYDTWTDSGHAQAFLALEERNKAFDPDCIRCHSVGFDKPGGFIDLDVTFELANVQCESCHGAARAHAESAGAQAPANKGWPGRRMCAQCHTQAHSPEFDFAVYWPRIAH
ncbi:MAG TPA: hypothetical protein ENJ19_10390 [Gammaproteobacteria bacterium]|nr:hypothetical protein [Gammaproteobacteria bacterium]